MFARREQRKFHQKLRASIWPEMGWRRLFHYYRHRLMRETSSTHKIAAGLAIGASVSFSPLLGTHSIEAILLGWIFRANKLAAWIGTGLCNPLTLPLQFWLDYKLGTFIFSLAGYEKALALPDHPSLSHLMHHPVELLAPMVLGSVVIGVAMWPVAYALLYYPVHKMRRAYYRYRHWK